MAVTEPVAPATNAELIRWAFDVLNTHDVTPLKEFWTADTVERFPTRTARGAEEISAVFDSFPAARFCFDVAHARQVPHASR